MLTLQIVVALLALACGPVLLWWRRDNVLGYLAAGIFVATYLLPLAPTLANYRLDRHTVTLYADLLAVGAALFLAGLALGHQIGARSPNKVPLTFARPVSGRLLGLVTSRARWIAVGGIVALAAAFLLMRYVPLFAADRTSAKYGVGVYRAAFERASLVYRLGLAVSASILPVILAVYWRNRRLVDLVLSLGLVGGLFVSLSRDLAFVGPLVFAIAVAVERGWRPGLIATLVVAVSSVGVLVTLVFIQPGRTPEAVATRIATSAPDIRDHLGFVQGFERRGEPTYGRTLVAGLSLQKSPWEPSTYALRTLTGISDLRELAAGGLRLPAPLWGYASFGWAGVAVFSGLSGVFAGWGVTKVRRLLTPVLHAPGIALNLTLAYVFYEATFGALSEFYYTSSSIIVKLAVAVAIGVAVRVVLVRGTEAASTVRPPGKAPQVRSAR